MSVIDSKDRFSVATKDMSLMASKDAKAFKDGEESHPQAGLPQAGRPVSWTKDEANGPEQTGASPVHAKSSARTYMTSRDAEGTESVKKMYREVLAKVTEAAEMELRKKRTRSATCGILPDSLSMDFEEEFDAWFHEMSVIKKLASRLAKQELAISILTVFDLWAIMLSKERVLWMDHVIYGQFRLQVFLMCRLLAFTLLTYWRALAVEGTFIRENPQRVQKYLILSYMAIAVSLFVSYGAITNHGATDEQRGHGFLFFAFICHAIFMQLPVTLLQSWSLVLFSVFIMLFSVWFDFTSGLFPDVGEGARFFFVLMSLTTTFGTYEEEIRWRERFETKKQMEDIGERIESILDTMMPVMVYQEIRELDMFTPLPSHKYNNATIVQADLVGFTALSSSRKPADVVWVLAQIFLQFDDLSDKYGIYKVETVGDTYIAGQASAPLTSTHSPLTCILFALDMIRATHEWSRKHSERVSCAAGIHHGAVLGGIVGTEMQRYHLFGKLMHVVSVLEATAPAGKVQVSEACKNAVEQQVKNENIKRNFISFEMRTDLTLQHTANGTSGAARHTYDEVGGPTYIVRSYGRMARNQAAQDNITMSSSTQKRVSTSITQQERLSTVLHSMTGHATPSRSVDKSLGLSAGLHDAGPRQLD